MSLNLKNLMFQYSDQGRVDSIPVQESLEPRPGILGHPLYISYILTDARKDIDVPRQRRDPRPGGAKKRIIESYKSVDANFTVISPSFRLLVHVLIIVTANYARTTDVTCCKLIVHGTLARLLPFTRL